jgi:heat-inducible transcriptional repressor
MHQPQLTPRAAAILDAVIERFILTGEPVGSGAIAGMLPERVSPATVRNVMAELERLGYLEQPHTSAGRLPTPAGYQLYVEGLMADGRLLDLDESQLRARLDADPLEVRVVLERSCRLLAEVSSLVGLVSAPPLSETAFQHIDFVALDGGRVLAIVVGRSGQVTNRIVSPPAQASQGQLDRAAHYLERRFAGRSLREVALRLQELRDGINERLDDYERQAIRLGAESFAQDIETTELLVEGASQLLGNRDFEAREDIQAVLATLEEGRQLTRALGAAGGAGGLRVLIGAERLPASLGGCTVVAATYHCDGHALGSVAVLGPTRLHYARAMALVDSVARVTTTLFSQLRI